RVVCPSARSVLRPTPAGRSLKIPSPLVSWPVSSVYGGALLVLTLRPMTMLRTTWLLIERLRRCLMSTVGAPPPNTACPGMLLLTPPPPPPPAAGPHSVSSVPVGETLNGPSVLLRSDANV